MKTRLYEWSKYLHLQTLALNPQLHLSAIYSHRDSAAQVQVSIWQTIQRIHSELFANYNSIKWQILNMYWKLGNEFYSAVHSTMVPKGHARLFALFWSCFSFCEECGVTRWHFQTDSQTLPSALSRSKVKRFRCESTNKRTQGWTDGWYQVQVHYLPASLSCR